VSGNTKGLRWSVAVNVCCSVRIVSPRDFSRDYPKAEVRGSRILMSVSRYAS
jgi:hypothetical protein